MCARLLAIASIMALAVGFAGAQEADDPLAGMRGSADINDQNTTAIREFVTAQVGAAAGSDAAQARTAIDRLRGGYDGTPAFKAAYGTAAIDAISSAYKKANDAGAARLLAVVNTFRDGDAIGLYLEALQDNRVGVRAAAALGLARLRESIAASGADAVNRVLTSLLAAARTEKSQETLRWMYAAMNYQGVPNPPDAQRTAAILLELLEARAALYGKDDSVPAVGADDEGLRIAQGYSAALDDAGKKRLMAATATMMKHALERYTMGERKLADVKDQSESNPLADYRDAMERLVLRGEQVLTALLKPAQDAQPAVFAKLANMDLVGARNEWKKWVTLLRDPTNQDFALEVTDDADTAEPGAAQ